MDALKLMDFLKSNDLNFTNIPAEGKFGKVNILFFTIHRERPQVIMDAIKDFNPESFYTVEAVKNVSDYHVGERSRKFSFLRLLNTKRR